MPVWSAPDGAEIIAVEISTDDAGGQMARVEWRHGTARGFTAWAALRPTVTFPDE